IREYTADYKPTGRAVWLRKGGKPLLLHPTGLAFHRKWGTFLGDTVNKKAIIYRLDWAKMWEDGHLDRAVLDVVADDAAVNGCRPLDGGRGLFVTSEEKDNVVIGRVKTIPPRESPPEKGK